jgi:hypothetical protein
MNLPTRPLLAHRMPTGKLRSLRFVSSSFSAVLMLMAGGCQSSGIQNYRPAQRVDWGSAQPSGATASAALDLSASMPMNPLRGRGVVGSWHASFGRGGAHGTTFSFAADGHFTERFAGRTTRFGTYRTDTGTTPAGLTIYLSNGTRLYASLWNDQHGRLRMTRFFPNEREKNTFRYQEQEIYIMETAPEPPQIEEPTAGVISPKPLSLEWNGTYLGKPVGITFNGDIGFTMLKNGKVMRGNYLKESTETPPTLRLIEQNRTLHKMYYRCAEDKLILAEENDETFASPITLHQKSDASRKP